MGRKQRRGGELTTRMVLGPEWIAHRYDETTDQIRFIDVERPLRDAIPFLTDQYLPERAFRAMSREEARASAPATGPVHFIFHSGFCCSTLLASCLDQPGLATRMSEPMILNDIVGWRKRGAAPAAVGALLKDALDLLARPFRNDAAAIVKPSTLLNGLAPAMLRLRLDARAILIHAPLRDFLLSIAKKGLDGRLWARELFLSMRREGLTQILGFDDEAFFGQTDLQIAACDWLGQQAGFASLVDTYPDRIRTIASDQFLKHPEEAINAAAKLFGLPLTDDHIRSARAGPLSRNSKDQSDYSSDQRRAEYSAALQAHGDEVQKVEVWATEVARVADIPLQLPAPLL